MYVLWFVPARIWYSAGGGGNAPPAPPGTTSTMPWVSWVERSRLKSTIAWGSTPYLAASASTVSLDFATTTMPCTGGMTICWPVSTTSLENRLSLLDHRTSATLTWELPGVTHTLSPDGTIH